MSDDARLGKAFKIGDRVRISPTHHWAQGMTGIIAVPGTPASAFAEDWPKAVQARRELLYFYFVTFDRPQIDADGDGPYSGGEIDIRYLELVSV